MKIYPQVSTLNPTSEAVPIKVYISNRADLTALLLRVLRYLFQQGIAGKDLIWSDSETCKIWIEDSFLESPDNVNTVPSITLSCGGISFTKETTDRNRTMYDLDTSDVYSRHLIPVTLEIRGRNKLETYKISEVVAAALFLLTPQITENCPNIYDIINIQASPISPLSNLEQAGDDSKIFAASVSFLVEYCVGFRVFKLGDLFTAAVFVGNVSSKSNADVPMEFNYIKKIKTQEQAAKDELASLE